jgi:hypothetical protein
MSFCPEEQFACAQSSSFPIELSASSKRGIDISEFIDRSKFRIETVTLLQCISPWLFKVEGPPALKYVD